MVARLPEPRDLKSFVRSPGCELAMGTVSAATSFLVPVSLSIFLHHARVQCRERYACTSLDVTAAAYMHACVLRGAVGGGETDDVIIEYCCHLHDDTMRCRVITNAAAIWFPRTSLSSHPNLCYPPAALACRPNIHSSVVLLHFGTDASAHIWLKDLRRGIPGGIQQIVSQNDFGEVASSK